MKRICSDTAKAFANADIFLWIGNDAIYCRDNRKKTGGQISYLENGSRRMPYVPGFHDIWKDSAYFCERMAETIEQSFLRRVSVLLAVPEDISEVEKIALEDFVYVSIKGLKKNRGLLLCPKCLALHNPMENFIGITKSCRCYTVSLVRNGGAEERELVDVNQCSEEALVQRIQCFQKKYPQESLEVYYPQLEEDVILPAVGTAVPLEDMADNFLLHF